MATKTKQTKSEQQSENAAKAKTISGKKLIELEHTEGKHDHMKGIVPDCGYCYRRLTRMTKKAEATKRYLAMHK